MNNMILKLNDLKDTHERQVDKNRITIRLFYLLFFVFCFSLFIIGSIFINYLIKIPKGYELLELNSKGFIMLPILFLSLCSICFFIYPFFSKKFLARSYLFKNNNGIKIDELTLENEVQDYNKIMLLTFFGIYNLSEEEEIFISKKNRKTKDQIYQIFS